MKRVSDRKMSNYLELAEIYNFLAKEFPHLFLLLDKVPRELDHPGDQPKGPERILKATIQILPEDNFATLLEKFKDIQHYRMLERFSAYIDRPILNQLASSEPEPDLDDDDSDEFWSSHYTPPVYGEPRAISLTFHYEDPDYKSKQDLYNHEVKNWQDRIVQRRTRNEVIASVITQNLNRINQARSTYHELWVMAARKMKGENDPTWVQKKLESLEQQIAALKQQIDPKSTESE